MLKKELPHKKCDPENMKNAVDETNAIFSGAKKFQRSKIYFERRIELQTWTTLRKQFILKIVQKPVFSPDMEEGLVHYCLKIDKSYYGLETRNFRHPQAGLSACNKK